MNKKRYWADLTAREFATLDTERQIAVLPVGAIEQHGPHLPLSVDSVIVDALIERTVDRLGDLPVLFLPTMSIGKSNEHIAFPGTLTLSARTLIRLWMDVGDSVARAGVRKLIILNGHGGNTGVTDIVARDLRAKHGMLTASCSWYSLLKADDLFDPQELIHGIHAGDGETSVMMAIRPDLVETSQIANFPSKGQQWSETFSHIRVGSGGAKMGWLIQDLNLEGACGDASAASAEKGEVLLERGVQGLIELLGEFNELPSAHLDAFPD